MSGRKLHIECWKVIRPDFHTRNGYRWPFPGSWATVPSGRILKDSKDACPRQDGDGLCLAKTWRGAASGGMPAIAALHVGYYRRDVLGEDKHKMRVRRAFVLDVLDPPALARAGFLSGADLSDADLSGANLSDANLEHADLSGANLLDANLRNADLRGASLLHANLGDANLEVADLSGADLRGTILWGANLRGADLWSANLEVANLRGADLRGADLRGANLRYANLEVANLRYANLEHADLRGANLLDANLRGAINVPVTAVGSGHRTEAAKP